MSKGIGGRSPSASEPDSEAQPGNTAVTQSTSYGQILRSSAILGGTQGIIYLVLIFRTKLAAVILGPVGVGTFGLYQAIVAFVGTLSNLGISTSAVREIADAGRDEDHDKLARSAAVVERVSWFTGFFGWTLMLLFAYPICLFTFDSTEMVWAVAMLGSTLIFSGVASGKAAIMQGRRRIGDLARFQLISTTCGVVLNIALYLWLGKDGIIPGLIGAGLTSYLASWYFGRRAPLPKVKILWREVWRASRGLVALGLAFMWNAVLTGAVALATRAIIVRDMGLEATGIYQAAWGISGMFAGFILSAMGTDFFPRLTAVSDRPAEVNRLVNEQTEIGILLALPGLLFTLALAPWLMQIFYTKEFSGGSALLPWFVLGVFGQVLSWPLGFIQMAMGASKRFAITQTLFNVIHFSLILFLFGRFGLIGISYAFPALYGIYAVGMLLYCKRLTGFRWSPAVVRLVALSTAVVVVAFGASALSSGRFVILIQLAMGIGAGCLMLRGLMKRLPYDHRIQVALRKIFGRFPCFG